MMTRLPVHSVFGFGHILCRSGFYPRICVFCLPNRPCRFHGGAFFGVVAGSTG
ncbi:hypothetical protein COLSTE_00595 [Collinsella stercoris DSM 13279]|uniref:Uncharacterized protein n=1 Tax=Collinsella stercoris DSM 13279 TaxID=445975 RepID=B6G954_9ACTN|nr:hypothetical protein COLSTE_00595 [Collinsella stercoris DSM 13279]